jgi:hypothetical protein
MTFYDTATGQWENVKDTCNPPWESVDPVLQLYSVHLCHLTQFGLFYWQAPVVRIASLAGQDALVLDENDQLKDAAAQADAVANPTDNDSPPEVVITLPTTITLDGSQSEAPAGYIANTSWTIIEAPSAAVARAGSLSHLAGATLTHPLALVTQMSVPLEAGFWSFVLGVEDDLGAIRYGTQRVLVNTAPQYVTSRHFYAPASLGFSASQLETPVAGSESSAAYHSAVSSIQPDDVVLDASLTYDPDEVNDNKITVTWAWDSAASAPEALLAPPTIVSPSSLITAVTGVDTAAYVFTLTLEDQYDAVNTTSVLVGRTMVANAGSNAALTTKNGWSLSAAGSRSYFALGSSDATVTWSVNSKPGLASSAPTIAQPHSINTAVTGITAYGYYTFGLLLHVSETTSILLKASYVSCKLYFAGPHRLHV